MQAIKDDPDCRPVLGSIGSLQLLSTRMSELNKTPYDAEIIALENQQRELLLASEAVQNDEERSEILRELRFVQVSLAQNRGYRVASKQETEIYQRSVTVPFLLGTANAVFSQALNNQQCWSKYGGLMQGLGGLGGVMAGTWGPTSSGIALASGLYLTSQIIDYIRLRRYNEGISNINQSLATTAYQCAIETLSDSWCGANDIGLAIRIKASASKGDFKKDELWRGLRMMALDAPEVVEWLELINTGAEPPSAAIGERQKNAYSRWERVTSARAVALGLIAEHRRSFEDEGKDKVAQWQILRRTILRIMDKGLGLSGSMFVGSGNEPHPLLDIYTAGEAPYVLLGVPPEMIPRNTFDNSPLAFSSFDPFSKDPSKGWPPGLGSFVPSLDTARTQLLEWTRVAEDRAQNDITHVTQLDPVGMLARGKVEYRGHSAHHALENLVEYMEAHAPSIKDDHLKALVHDTHQRLAGMRDALGTPLSGHGINPLDILAKIYTFADMEFGTVFFRERLSLTFQLTLQNVLEKESQKGNHVAARLLAAENVLSEFTSLFSGPNDDQLAHQVDDAQRISENNLRHFSQVFAKGMRRSLEDLRKQIELTREEPQGSKRRIWAKLCLHLATLPEWPKEVPLKLCEGAQLISVFGDQGPKSEVVSTSLLNQPFQQRACLYRDYVRQVSLYQNKDSRR